MKTVTSFPRIRADQRGLIHSELTENIIGIFYEVYRPTVELRALTSVSASRV